MSIDNRDARNGIKQPQKEAGVLKILRVQRRVRRKLQRRRSSLSTRAAIRYSITASLSLSPRNLLLKNVAIQRFPANLPASPVNSKEEGHMYSINGYARGFTNLIDDIFIAVSVSGESATVHINVIRASYSFNSSVPVAASNSSINGPIQRDESYDILSRKRRSALATVQPTYKVT